MFDHNRQGGAHAGGHFAGSPFQYPVAALGEPFQRSVVKSPPMGRQQMVVEDIDGDPRVASQVLRQTCPAAAKDSVLVGEQIRLLVQPNAPQNAIRHPVSPTSLQEVRQHLADDVVFVVSAK